ncbi:hypothetical protein WKI68_07140 [Streptomyces sp. MS1.HAVA.3]|uniref:Glycosyltransferase family 28 N-terminal domain-containing protein n=1 Tax=Streptomyces caledonius TaxID=3134107 RepID=A0ABU8U0A1_9ACTN
MSALVTEALRRAGVRGIVQAGWSGLHAEGDELLTVQEVPHAWLFRRTAAVIHHAGAGTTAAGLRAGVPAVPSRSSWTSTSGPPASTLWASAVRRFATNA